MVNPYDMGEPVDDRIALFEEMKKDPEALAYLEKGVAKVAPHLAPNVKFKETIEQRISAIEAANKAELAKRDEDFENYKAQQEINKQTNSLKAKGLSEGDIKNIKDLMTTNGIVNFDTATEYYNKLVRPTLPNNAEPVIPKLEDNLYPKEGKTMKERKDGFINNLHTLADKMHAEGKI